MSTAENAVPVICLGWTAENADISLWRPQAPKSYTKPETIANWIQEQIADAPVLPYVGQVVDIKVRHPMTRRVETFGISELADFVGLVDSFAKFSELPVAAGELTAPKALFIGFNVPQLFMSVAATLQRQSIRVPVRMWHHPLGLLDINNMLIPGALRNGFDIGSLLMYAGAPDELTQFSGPGAANMETALDRLLVTEELARFAQLI